MPKSVLTVLGCHRINTIKVNTFTLHNSLIFKAANAFVLTDGLAGNTRKWLILNELQRFFLFVLTSFSQHYMEIKMQLYAYSHHIPIIDVVSVGYIYGTSV